MKISGSQDSTIKRDQFWRGAPPSVKGFAALDRDGNIMLSSVHKRRSDVRFHCGECVPIRVEVTYIEDDGRASDE